MDAVILAGGRSERLNGVVPPFHKPFLVVEGESLLVAAVHHARSLRAERIVVVASAENVLPATQLLAHHNPSEVVVVTASGGPGPALRLGLELCRSADGRVLVLLSDNVHRDKDVMELGNHRYGVGVQFADEVTAQRFTRRRGDEWIEGPWVDRAPNAARQALTWSGLLLVDRDSASRALGADPLIGPHIGELTPSTYGGPDPVRVCSYDVGVWSELVRLTGGGR